MSEDHFDDYVDKITRMAMIKPVDDLREFIRSLVTYVSELETLVLTYNDWEEADLVEYKNRIRAKLAVYGIKVEEE
jgi:hypothetical protein